MSSVSLKKTMLQQIHMALGVLNDLLLFPMFSLIVLEILEPNPKPHQAAFINETNLLFCALFFLEWIMGLMLAEYRKNYLFNFTRQLDLISTIPLGSAFQGLRLVRLTRILKLLRVVLRAKRYHGPGKNLVRVLAIVFATTFAGAYTIVLVETAGSPDRCQSIESELASENISPEEIAGAVAFQSENCPPLTNLPDALWWSMVTISTVGYGDYVPKTPVGRMVATALILLGVGVVGYIAGFMTNLMNVDEDDERQEDLLRIEAKLDALALHLDLDSSTAVINPTKESS